MKPLVSFSRNDKLLQWFDIINFIHVLFLFTCYLYGVTSLNLPAKNIDPGKLFG